MIVFIDEYKNRTSRGLRWGIEPICDLLPIAPATYYAVRKRAPSARQVRDVGCVPRSCGSMSRTCASMALTRCGTS